MCVKSAVTCWHPLLSLAGRIQQAVMNFITVTVASSLLGEIPTVYFRGLLQALSNLSDHYQQLSQVQIEWI